MTIQVNNNRIVNKMGYPLELSKVCDTFNEMFKALEDVAALQSKLPTPYDMHPALIKARDIVDWNKLKEDDDEGPYDPTRAGGLYEPLEDGDR